MTLMPESDSSSVETISPMRCWLGAGRVAQFLHDAADDAVPPPGRNSTEKMASSHEMATIITM